MKFSHFFIDRPIFAAVISIVITLVGIVGYVRLPVSQYPDIVPPSITVTVNYPGASPEILMDTAIAPLEREINGVENMMYMQSQCNADGSATITVTFEVGTNIDTAQVLVQNRIAVAEPRLPEEVRSIGVTVRKRSPDMLVAANLYSPDGSRDKLYLTNYAITQMKDRLARVYGVDGDAERPSFPRAEGKEGAALDAPADDTFFSRVCAVSGADAAIDVHSALYAEWDGAGEQQNSFRLLRRHLPHGGRQGRVEERGG